MNRGDDDIIAVQARSLHTGRIPSILSSSSSFITTDGDDVPNVPLVRKGVEYQTTSTVTLTDEEGETTMKMMIVMTMTIIIPT
jgi:hypothetical protein